MGLKNSTRLVEKPKIVFLTSFGPLINHYYYSAMQIITVLKKKFLNSLNNQTLNTIPCNANRKSLSI